MSEFKKPMLAATIKNVEKDIQYPCTVSLKLDGIRAIVIDGVVLSRSMKKIPNKAIQAKFGREEFNNLDGELIVGRPNATDVFNKTTSQVMTIEGSADNVFFHFFDIVNSDLGRKAKLHNISTNAFMNPEIKTVHEEVCESLADVLDFETRALEGGYEGIMIRSRDGYKQGRSTLKEGYLSKLKRFSDSECIIIGFEERMRNMNVAKINETGHQVRSSALAGLEPSGTLGAILVRDTVTGIEFSIGSGFDDAMRQQIWNDKDSYMGRLVTYKHFEHGVVTAPRHPIFKGFRAADDMS